VFEDNDWNEQRVAATGQGIVRKTVCCDEILTEKKRSLSQDFNASVLQAIFSDTFIVTCIARHWK